MKKESGITLLTLIVYVIVLTFIVATVSTINMTFYSNLEKFDGDAESTVGYSKFNMYFLKDIKKENVKVLGKDETYIILSCNGEQIEYSVQNKALYKNKIKICSNIEDSSFDVNGNKITVFLKIGEFEKTTTYAIENA